MIKEKPILFSSPMVRAIREDRKTQTRRVMKSQPYTSRTEGFGYPTKAGWFVSLRSEHCLNECPYGKPGERLYVKEAAWMWCERRPNGITKSGRPKSHYVPLRAAPIFYVADGCKPSTKIVHPDTGNEWGWRFKVARFMPRWASRITLEITDGRVERLQDISDGDARAEGVEQTSFGDDPSWKY